MHVVRSTLAVAVAACTVTACGGEEHPASAPLLSAAGLPAPAYEPGAADARADIPYGGASRGSRAKVTFVDDEPRTCRTDRRDRLLRFSLSVGPDQVATGRSGDKVRLRTGPIGTRAGQRGFEARILHQVVEIGGAGPQASGAAESVRLADDLRSGTAVIGRGDARVTITFRC